MPETKPTDVIDSRAGASPGDISPNSWEEAETKTPAVASSQRYRSKPLSVKFMRTFSGLLCCHECQSDSVLATAEYDEKSPPSALYNLQSLRRPSSSISPLVSAPMLYSTVGSPLAVEAIIGEYIAACRLYGCADRINAGVLTAFRFSLPSLRVSGSFHDNDMLALVEVLLRHANGALGYIQRFDFTFASKEGKQNNRVGFTSHGALSLAKVLQMTKHVREVLLPRHRIGPYGASAIFLACSQNPTITTLGMRRCRIGERGALAFAELLCSTTSNNTGLQEVDLSANGIGHRGTAAIERALEKRMPQESTHMDVDLEGNLVFPEIMNGCTHGLGIVLSWIGGIMLSNRIKGLSRTHDISCAIYTTSLLTLYTSSTLYHSFFSLQNTKYVFEVFDKCAIYILIAGSYTPFLQIILSHKPIWSVGLLSFIWVSCFCGICVEAFLPSWRYRGQFSLSMYLCMGWSCLVCLPEMMERLPQGCINLLILGGVGYTAGVPFFVRNNNLDHSIWHLFVLSGSIFHWLAVYIYVAPLPLAIPIEILWDKESQEL